MGAACAGLLALCQVANANIIEISLDPGTHTPSDVPFNDITGNPASVLGWLQGEVLSYNNNIPGAALPDPTTNQTRYDSPPAGTVINVVKGDYIDIHSGVGNGGVPGTGGGLAAYYVDADGTFTVPANGPGPNGVGGVSFVDVWDHVPGRPPGTVPDGGMTLAMLGMGLGGMGLFARSSSRKTSRT